MLAVPPRDPVPEGPLHIGDVSQLTGLSLRSIRHYEDLGLVTPCGRTDGGFRVYDAEAVERLRLVMALKLAGFSLEETTPVVEACRARERRAHPCASGDVGRAIAEGRERVARAVDDLESRLDSVRALLARLQDAAD